MCCLQHGHRAPGGQRGDCTSSVHGQGLSHRLLHLRGLQCPIDRRHVLPFEWTFALQKVPHRTASVNLF